VPNVWATVRPLPVVPSPKLHAYDVICVAPVPIVLGDASNVTGTPMRAVVGDIVNAAVGVPAGGRMTPGGTRRIVTVSGLTATKFVPVGVAMIVTQVPGEMPHVPDCPAGFCGGAV
jgi:hypothetical protein